MYKVVQIAGSFRFQAVLHVSHLFLHFMQFLFQAGGFVVWPSRRSSRMIKPSGRLGCLSRPESTRMSGTSCTLFLMSSRRRSFLCIILLVVSIVHLATVSFLIFSPILPLWRRLIVIEGLWRSWWLLPDYLP